MMSTQRIVNSAGLLFVFILLLLPFSLKANEASANYPLKIIQPQSGLDEANRFYKAYPELEYNVRMAVVGGVYPYEYELLASPSGMSIDQRTGEIVWDTPTERAEPYAITVRVTDQNGRSTETSWTVRVTPDGFLFVDAENGASAEDGGNGTIDAPFASLKDIYEGDDPGSVSRDTYSGYFVYWREGVYDIDAHLTDNKKVIFTQNRKPNVWLGFPGENPVIKVSAFLQWYGNTSNLYFQSLEFDMSDNLETRGLMFTGSAENVVVRKNEFHSIENGHTGGNSSFVYFTRSSSLGSNHALQDNIARDVNTGYWLLAYTNRYVLVEDNHLSNIGSHPVGPKAGNQHWFIRGNVFENNPQDSIWVYGGRSRGTHPTRDIEISHNLVMPGGGKVRINPVWSSSIGPVHMVRNTFLDKVQVQEITENTGPYTINRNVIINSWDEFDHIRKMNIEAPDRLKIWENLTGTDQDNIVGNDGGLSDDYKNYLGIRGYEIAE